MSYRQICSYTLVSYYCVRVTLCYYNAYMIFMPSGHATDITSPPLARQKRTMTRARTVGRAMAMVGLEKCLGAIVPAATASSSDIME